MPKNPLDIARKYAEGVRSGSIPSCQMIKLAVERWYTDWTREDLFFDRAAFVKVVRFFGLLKHFEGQWAGKPMILEPWQIWALANIFGWKRRENKKRRYNYADIYVPRKNGKTTFLAGIASYLLVADNENAAQVYSAATDKNQAKICFDASVQLLMNSPFSDFVQYFRKGSLVVEETASVYKPLSKDTKNKDGLNIHGAVCDERHAWRTNEIYEVLTSGIGARSQPLICSISTAGTDTSYPYYNDLEALRQVLLGIHEKDNHFIMLFEPDKEDKWDDEMTWRKVNPNYGVSIITNIFRAEYENARDRGGTTLANFQTKMLNMWVDAPEVWIPDDDVAANNAPFDEAQLAGQDCYVGVDLASKGDLTAAAFFFPKFNVVKYLFTVPEEKIKGNEGRADLVDYRLWQQQGWITACPGPVLDEEWWLQQLFLAMEPYRIRAIAYDPWGMWDLKQKFGKYADKLMEYRQDIRYMSVPTKDLESRVRRHELNLLDNPVIRWNFKNVTIYTDPNANIKLDKARSRNKIDGVVATVDAIGSYLNLTAGDTKEIYTTHTLRVISAGGSE